MVRSRNGSIAGAAMGVLMASACLAQMSLTTTFAGGNNFRGNMFDLVALGSAVTVESVDVNIFAGSHTVEIWHRPGSHVGFESTMVGWVMAGASTVTSNGPGVPTPIPAMLGVTIAAGQRHAFYVTNTIASMPASMNYTNGIGVGTLFASDANLEFYEGAGGDYFAVTFMPRVWNGNINYNIGGPTCVLNAPSMGMTVSGNVQFDFDIDHSSMLNVDALFQYSTDMGASWTDCLPVPPMTNPLTALSTPQTGLTFDWDSFGNSIGLVMPQNTDVRIEVDDATITSTCTEMGVIVDNVAPPPTCTLALTSGSPVSGIGSFEVNADSMNAAVVNIVFEYSTDAGGSWLPAAPAMGGSNPLIGVPIMTPTNFDWDSSANMIGTVMPQVGVLMRSTATDGVAMMGGVCMTAPFDVDNTALCQGICGDCDLNGAGPNILDALVAAQISATLITPTLAQEGCCDVNASMSVNILDALLIAQEAASLMPMIMCP